MADVELLIKIPEEVYRAYKKDCSLSFLNSDQKSIALYYLIAGLLTGKLLPKGHGNLKDEDNLKLSFVKWNMVAQDCFSYSDIDTIVHHSPTIIEADKEANND